MPGAKERRKKEVEALDADIDAIQRDLRKAREEAASKRLVNPNRGRGYGDRMDRGGDRRGRPMDRYAPPGRYGGRDRDRRDSYGDGGERSSKRRVITTSRGRAAADVEKEDKKEEGDQEDDKEKEDGDDEEEKPKLQSAVAVVANDDAPARPARPKRKRGAEVQKRDRRMFGFLRGHLSKAKTRLSKDLASPQQKKKMEVEKRVEVAIKEHRENVREKSFAAQKERRDREQTLRRKLMKKRRLRERAQLEISQGEHYEALSKFIQTKAEPRLFWMPDSHIEATEKLLEESALLWQGKDLEALEDTSEDDQDREEAALEAQEETKDEDKEKEDDEDKEKKENMEDDEDKDKKESKKESKKGTKKKSKSKKGSGSDSDSSDSGSSSDSDNDKKR